MKRFVSFPHNLTQNDKAREGRSSLAFSSPSQSGRNFDPQAWFDKRERSD